MHGTRFVAVIGAGGEIAASRRALRVNGTTGVLTHGAGERSTAYWFGIAAAHGDMMRANRNG